MKASLLIITCLIVSVSFSQTNNLLQYNLTQFNSDSCCWRKLSAAKQYNEAANLIVQYIRQSNMHENNDALNWHAGQMFASAGENKSAKKYFKKTYSFFYQFGNADAKAWRYYAKGTIAFIERNKTKLKKQLRKWERYHYTKDNNYKTLLSLLAKWDAGYATASK